MFSFFHPKPVVDGRAVAVQVVQQQQSAYRETRTLVVTTRLADAPQAAASDTACEK